MLTFLTERQKLDKKAKKLRFIGYCMNFKGYRLYDEYTRKIVKSRDVVFNETDFIIRTSTSEVVDVQPQPSHMEVNPVLSQNGADGAVQDVSEPRHSERDRR